MWLNVQRFFKNWVVINNDKITSGRGGSAGVASDGDDRVEQGQKEQSVHLFLFLLFFCFNNN